MRLNPFQGAKQTAFILSLWLLGSLALALGLYRYLDVSLQSEREAAFQRAEAAAAVAEQTLLRTIESVQSVMELVVIRQNLLDAGDEAGMHAIEAHLRATAIAGRFGIVQISITDRAGRVTWGSAPDAAGISIADREHFRVHFDGARPRLFLSAPVIGRTTGRWSLQVSRLLSDSRGDPTGVAVVSLDPLVLSGMLATQAPDPGEMIVIRRLLDGALLARNHTVTDNLADGPLPNHPILSRARSVPRSRIDEDYVYEGHQKMIAYRVPENLPVVVYAALDKEIEMADFQRIAGAVIGGGLIAILGGLAITLAWDRNMRLRHQLGIEATCDPLTGLQNRRAIEAIIPSVMASAADHNEAIGFLLFDLDHFKSINDQHGHAAGDTVLCDVARALRQEVRKNDLVCRWGGEEILVVLRDCGMDDAMRRAERLRETIAGLYDSKAGPVERVTASIGVACFPGDGDTLDNMVRCADEALYSAKANGRNRVTSAGSKPAPAAAASAAASPSAMARPRPRGEPVTSAARP